MKSKYARVYVSEAERPLMQFLLEYYDPTQFVPGHTVSQEVPERKLLIAVLQDAIHALKKPGTERHREAVKWFASNSDKDLFSFNSVCERLGLSESYVRKKIYAGVENVPSHKM